MAIPASLKGLYNDVKAINERIADIAREYGRDSEPYRKLERDIEMRLPPSLIGESKAGNIRIKQGAGDIGKLDADTIKDIKSNPTRGQYTEKIKREYKEEHGAGKPSRKQLREYSERRTSVQEAAENGKLKQILSEGKGGKKGGKRSYEELFALLQEADEEDERQRAELNEWVSVDEDETPFDDFDDEDFE